MSIVSFFFGFVLTLSMACILQKNDNRDANFTFKEGQLVLELVTDNQLSDQEEIRRILGLKKAEPFDIKMLTRSHLKDGKYRTMVVVFFEKEDFESIKIDFNKNFHVLSIDENRVYKENMYDIPISEEIFVGDQKDTEFDALYHRQIRTQKAMPCSRGEGDSPYIQIRESPLPLTTFQYPVELGRR